MKNNKLLILLVIILVTSLSLVACSNDESTNQAKNQSTSDKTTVENNNNANSEDEDSSGNIGDNENEEKEKNEHVEHQVGLEIGETGTVVSNTSNSLDDRISYEVTLNEVRYDENLDLKLFEEVFVVVDITIKNIDDEPFNLSDIFTPNLGNLESTVYFVPVDSEFVKDFSGISVLEGKLEPGETKKGNYVFDVPKADNYNFVFGKTSDQIVTYSQWELSAEEIK